jgi:2-polyprenyl-3-methyl-5-hydroxy-6-metoxy-1,4-benzoquinol methylase
MSNDSLPQLNIGIIKPIGVIAPHVIDGFIHALRQLNHNVMIVEQNADDIVNLIYNVPDFILAYGLNGFILHQNNEYIFRQSQIPLVSLYYDNPFMEMDERMMQEMISFPEYYYNFIWDDSFLDIAVNNGIPHVFPIMLATDPNSFYPLNLSKRINSLAFVGSLNEKKVEIANPEINQFACDVIQIKLNQLELPVLSICQQLLNLPQFCMVSEIYKIRPFEFWNTVYKFIHQFGSPFIRRYILDNIKKIPVDVYGPGVWNTDNLTFHDPVPYGLELSAVYQKHAVNLNVSSLQLETSVNNRVFDVFAAGGFLLTDYKDDLKKLFPKHWSEITFKDTYQLEEMSEYYLIMEKRRFELSNDLRNIVLTQNTYHHRSQQILENVFPLIKSNLQTNKQLREFIKADRLQNNTEREKEDTKYEGAINLNLAKLVPSSCKVILETGCADGLLGEYLLQNTNVEKVFALEINEKLASMADKRLTQVFHGDAENTIIPLEPQSVDCLIYGDSLEHMKDPYKLLSYHLTLLKPGGYVVCSIPNVRNLFLIENLLHGNWTYTEWGLLDNTHLRFLTRKELYKWFEQAGLKIEHIERSVRDSLWFNKMHKENDLNQEILARYAYLYDKALKGLDIAEDLKNWYRISDLSADEALDFITVQFHLRAKKAS